MLGIFIAVLISVIAYARGYRFDYQSRSITPTGILATSSSPKAAKVFVNNTLKGATDLNLTLPPGDYTVEMKKEGYTDWSKKISLKGEIVMSVDGLLFPKNPSLSPLTSLGLIKVIPVDQTDRLILLSNNNDPEKDGVYTFDIKQRPLSLLPPLKKILLKKNLPVTVHLENTKAIFSPDSRQAIFDFALDQGTVSYLLSLDEENQQPFDITASKDTLVAAWADEKNRQVTRILETFPLEFNKVASESARIVAFSPDETKVLYQAVKPAVIPLILNPPLIGATQTSEERSLQSGKLYVYDRKEDKNFPLNEVKLGPRRLTVPTPSLVPTKTLLVTPEETNNTILWYADSKHFLINEKKYIVAIDYEGGNRRTIYSGPFQENFFSVTSDGKLLVLSNLNPQFNQSPDIYEVGIH